MAICKNNELFENEVSPQFFISSCYDKCNSELGKASFIIQRYVISKGLGSALLRVKFTK